MAEAGSAGRPGPRTVRFRESFMNKWNVISITVIAAAAAWAHPQVVKTVFPTRDVAVAEEVLAPPVEKGADASPLIQAAIDRVSKAGGGTVFLPAGAYTIASRVVVREGVTLRGDYASQSLGRGTLLRITADKGNEQAPAAFSIERGSGLVGLTFWYPEQRMPDPIPYPWTVKNAEMPANDNQTIDDCTFVNAWKGVCIGPDGNEMHTFRRLRMCALKIGFSIDSTTDIGRLYETTVSPGVWAVSGLPGAPDAGALKAYLLGTETIAVDIGRSDWEYIRGLHVDGYCRGLVFRKGLRGVTNAVMADSDLFGCRFALDLFALNQVGFSAYRCVFSGSEAALRDEPGFDAVVQSHCCRFEGPVVNDGPGVATFQACDLARAPLRAACGQVLAQDSALGEVSLGAEVTRARLLGFDPSVARIVNAATKGDVMISSCNPFVRPPETVSPEPMVFPRPVSDALFVVTDFGASPTNADNAAAFQAALDAAGANRGGGTVYVPAGLYAFRHDLVVPSGVELRGCSGVPHHTVSAGSVLLVYQNRGQEDGPPFLSLKAGAGARGLTFWYPEQPLKEPVPYPWTVRSLGKACWLTDVTIGNAWQGVDFASHRSDGHRISYLAGAMFRRGLFVGDSKKKGWVEDVQFNPHYMVRLPNFLPRTEDGLPGKIGHSIIQFQREKLEGIVFRDCRDEQVRGTFLYAAYAGLAFRGKNRVRVLMHGSDACSRAASFDTRRGSEEAFALAQLVTLGDWSEATIVTAPTDGGTHRFYNSQMWAGAATAVLKGHGTVRLEQFNTLTGPVASNAGRLEVVNGVFHRALSPHVTAGASAEGAIVGTICTHGPLYVEGARDRVRRFADSASVRPALLAVPSDAPTAWGTSFEPGDPAAVEDTVARRGGGLRKVSGNRCGAVARSDAHTGGRALMLRGVSDDPAYSFVYQTVWDKPVFVMPDTALTYWIKPLNENGRATAIDLRFSDGRTLRESGVSDTEGRGAHPGGLRGTVGLWTRVEVPLGKFAGTRVETVMAAYDTRKGGGLFETLFDDLSIAADLPLAAWNVQIELKDGCVGVKKGASVRVRYTLDGSDPTADSPLYEGPVAVKAKGPVEVRVAPLRNDGTLMPQVFAALFEAE